MQSGLCHVPSCTFPQRTSAACWSESAPESASPRSLPRAPSAFVEEYEQYAHFRIMKFTCIISWQPCIASVKSPPSIASESPVVTYPVHLVQDIHLLLAHPCHTVHVRIARMQHSNCRTCREALVLLQTHIRASEQGDILLYSTANVPGAMSSSSQEGMCEVERQSKIHCTCVRVPIMTILRSNSPSGMGKRMFRRCPQSPWYSPFASPLGITEQGVVGYTPGPPRRSPSFAQLTSATSQPVTSQPCSLYNALRMLEKDDVITYSS